MKSVYRVDSEYLTTDEVRVFQETPMNIWLPVLQGEGEYIYKKSMKKLRRLW